MGFNSAGEALSALVHAYYDERDVEAALSCVTDDVEWVGTENNDSASGKQALRELLLADVAAFPGSFGVELEKPQLQDFGDTVIITVTGKQIAVPGVICGFSVRGTACCVKTADGWLIANVHTSVPNSETEKYSLEKELDDNRKREQTLLAGIPGGVAIYRLKKDGSVRTEYVSDGLAKMCGYETGKEFEAYLSENALINVVEEDAASVMAAVEDSLKTRCPVSVIYRIHVRGGDDILQRLDANIIESELSEDDVAVWYAVHTIVSEESKEIIRDRRQLHELVDSVPAGIGIYEVEGRTIRQMYVNDAFYRMLGTTRESRTKYFGENTLLAAHPDDVPLIQKAAQKLILGESDVSVTYRLKTEDGGWFWVNLTGTVVRRSENGVRINAVFSDFNEIKRTQKNEEDIRRTLSLAMKSAKVLAWKYDNRTHFLTDTLTLGEAYHLPKTLGNVPESIISLGYIAEESLEPFREFFTRLSESAPTTVDTKAVVDKSGRYIWFRIIDTPVYDEKGNFTGSIGTALDITEQKEQELKYEEQLRLDQKAAQNSLSKVYVNLSKNSIVSYDHVASELFGRHTAAKSADELLSCVRYDVSAEGGLEKFDEVCSCASVINAFKNGKSHIEITCRLNNSTIWVKVIYDVLKNPYSGDIEMISSIHDVTELVRSELVVHKLLDVDYKSILLIDSQTGLSIPFKRDGVDEAIDELNGGMEKTGSQSGGLEAFFRAHALPDKVDEIIYENSPETIAAVLETEPFYECMYALREDGGVHQYKVTYSYLESDRRILLSAVQDVTQLYEKEIRQKNELAAALKEADAANKAKTAFLSRISHDMRTPLNGILGLTMLLRDSVTDNKLSGDLSDLEMSGRYLLNLINDTLDMSRIESGKLELHPVVCDGRALFNNTLSLARQSIDAKHIRLNIHMGEDIHFTKLYVDVARVQQVIMNVIGNAVKFTPEEGQIDVSIKSLSNEDGVITDEIKIRDNGIGMSAEFLPHVFESFEQEDATRTSSTNGTGLGMAITKQLLCLMGGDISVESEQGKGSCFTIVLRMDTASPQQIDEWQKDQLLTEDTAQLKGKRILLCEDHPLNTQIATRLLCAKGVLVEHAENGQIGVSMFSHSVTNYYDAILMDIRMPVMDGLDATRAIRSLSRRDARMVPIIAMTANAFSEDIRQTKDAGMDAHLSKPIQREVLFSTLAGLMNVDRDRRKQVVLVVDDLEVNRAVIRTTLEKDYEIIEAENGKQALDIVGNTAVVDAVITDIQMPEMDGIKLISALRADDKFRHIVIIANTQFGDPGQEEQLLALGANDFVYKPTTPKIVEIRVRNALRRM